jgi:hypothetical protein
MLLVDTLMINFEGLNVYVILTCITGFGGGPIIGRDYLHTRKA